MPIITKIEPKIKALPQLKRVAAYARVSMETERLHHSLSAQISYYSELIQKNPEWEYAGVYADEGLSGTNTEKRPEFQRMLADCEAGKIDIILTKGISRFARNTVDLLETVRHLKELGIEVRFEKEHINSLSGDGEVMLTLLASFAQEESRSISDNCKWGIRKRYENGETGGCKIYGYRTVNGNLVIQEDEAKVVRRIFQMFLDGDSCYRICQKLTAEGVKSYAGKDFQNTVVLSMIRQEKYAGCTLCQKFHTESYITHERLRNNGELPMYFLEGTHPAIISMETFRAAQEEFARRYGVEIKNGIAEKAGYMYHIGANGKPDKPHRSPQWSEESRKKHSEYFSDWERNDNLYTFSRFITCEGCGAHLRTQGRSYPDGSYIRRWICDTHKNSNSDSPKPPPLYQHQLEKQIAEVMEMDAFDEEEMFEKLSGISILDDVVTLHYKDGEERKFKYIQVRKKRVMSHGKS